MEIENNYITLEEPVTEDQLLAIEGNADLKSIQARFAVRREVWRRLNATVFKTRPHVRMRIFGGYTEPTNLDVLYEMTNVKKLWIDCLYDVYGLAAIEALVGLEELNLGIYHLTSLDVLASVPSSLKRLALGSTRSKKPDLAILHRFACLENLSIDGISKNLDVLGGLRQLKFLTLRSVSPPNLGFLEPLSELRSLALKLGGLRDYSALAGVSAIKYLEIWKVRGVDQVDFLGNLGGLESLFLQSLPDVTAVPSLEGCAALNRVVLVNMKGLRDFSWLRSAPVLEDFALIEGKNQEVDDFKPLFESRSLKRVWIDLMNDRRTAHVAEAAAACGRASLIFDGLRGASFHLELFPNAM